MPRCQREQIPYRLSSVGEGISKCPIVGVGEGILPRCWYEWKELCNISGVMGGNVPHRCQNSTYIATITILAVNGRNRVIWWNYAPSMVLMGGIISHHGCQWEELYPIMDVSGRNWAKSLLIVAGIVPQVSFRCKQWASFFLQATI